MSASQMLIILLLGGLMGLLGQGSRAVVGLKTMVDDAQEQGVSAGDLFQAARLLVSLAIGFLVGLAAALIYLSGGLPTTANPLDWHILLSFAASGYVGVDFLEGFISKYLPQPASPAAKAVAAKAMAAKALELPRPINEDVILCATDWLKAKHKMSPNEPVVLTKNISDFQINTNVEMEECFWAVVKCLKGKGYTYILNPPQNSPHWNQYITLLRSGTLSDFITDFVLHTS